MKKVTTEEKGITSYSDYKAESVKRDRVHNLEYLDLYLRKLKDASVNEQFTEEKKGDVAILVSLLEGVVQSHVQTIASIRKDYTGKKEIENRQLFNSVQKTKKLELIEKLIQF